MVGKCSNASCSASFLRRPINCLPSAVPQMENRGALVPRDWAAQCSASVELRIVHCFSRARSEMLSPGVSSPPTAHNRLTSGVPKTEKSVETGSRLYGFRDRATSTSRPLQLHQCVSHQEDPLGCLFQHSLPGRTADIRDRLNGPWVF